MISSSSSLSASITLVQLLRCINSLANATIVGSDGDIAETPMTDEVCAESCNSGMENVHVGATCHCMMKVYASKT